VFAASAVAQLALWRMADCDAVRAGAALLASALVLVIGAAVSRSVALLLTAALIGGLGQGLAFTGSLAAVNRQAPDTHRGGVASAYYVAAYLGNAVPVLGLGMLSILLGLATATLVFAAVLAPLALLVADTIHPATADRSEPRGRPDPLGCACRRGVCRCCSASSPSVRPRWPPATSIPWPRRCRRSINFGLAISRLLRGPAGRSWWLLLSAFEAVPVGRSLVGCGVRVGVEERLPHVEVEQALD
jgi:MFS family permease